MFKLKIKLIKLVVVVLLFNGIISITGCQNNSTESTSVETIVDRYYSWPAYTLSEAIEKADHIVYGKVVENNQLVSHEGPENSPKTTNNDLKIKVIKVLKTSEVVSVNTDNIVYYEIPNTTDEDRYDIPTNLKIGQEVVVFLNKYSRSLGPDFVIPVENGKAKMTPYFMKIAFENKLDSVDVALLLDKITNQ